MSSQDDNQNGGTSKGPILIERNKEDIAEPVSTASAILVSSENANDNSNQVSDTKCHISVSSKTDSVDDNTQPSISNANENQEPKEKINKVTNESNEASSKSDHDDASAQSRELKLLLALSKEANLDTNLSRKRKSLGVRRKTENRGSPNKGAKIQYPVTAESELEMEIQHTEDPQLENKSDNFLGSPSFKAAKRKKGSLSDASGDGAAEESAKKNRKLLISDVTMFKPNKDMFCWRCHKDNVNIACETCPRSYHQKCLKQTINNQDHWPCPECVSILKAESTHTRSPALKGMTLEHLCSLLKFAVNRMTQCQGSEPFINAVNEADFPEYRKYIIQPMDLTLIRKNIKENLYGSTQAFEADAKWILHNSIIFNSYHSKLTTVAKGIIKICKQEMAEIENCPTCYLNANTKKNTWFVEVCPKPHLLVWAKLRGFPFWPGKAMSCKDGMVDVRFFGAHDRAWVPEKECFLYSPKDPNSFRVKRADIEECVEELNVHVINLKKEFGEFRYPPFKTPVDPNNEAKQLQVFLPQYKPNTKNVKTPKKQFADKTKIDSAKQEKDSSKNESKEEPKENKEKIIHNDDEIIAGYGTDDDEIPEINTELRKKFMKSSEEDEKLEGDDDDDTQVPSNIEPDKNGLNEIVLTKGALKSFPADRKNEDLNSSSILTESNDTTTKPSKKVDDDAQSKKSLRRDSDAKSDSARLSDKINHVDISENMEISLGNEKGSVGYSENISSNSSECSSDFGVEIKKKPVQVDVDNVEFTISPASKLKMSDKLIGRLSDKDNTSKDSPSTSNANSESLQNVKRDLNSDKSAHTTKLIEKLKEIVQPAEPSVDSELSSDTFDPVSSTNESHIEYIHEDEVNESDTGEVTEVTKEKETALVSTSSTETKTSSADSHQLDKSDVSNMEINDQDEDNDQSSDENSADENTPLSVISKLKSNDVLSSHKAVDSQNLSKESATSNDSVVLSDKSLSESSSDPKKKSNSPELVQEKEVIRKESSKKASEQSDENDIVFTIDDEDVEEAQPVEDPLKDVEINIDKEKIINIIHSSLSDSSNSPEKPASSSEKTIRMEVDERKTSTPNVKKRKLVEGDKPETMDKIIKIVSTEIILAKGSDKENQNKNESPLLQKSLESQKNLKHSSTHTSPSGSTRSSLHEAPFEIKSEPESESEVGNVLYMEAKKKYLSALNILEKSDQLTSKPKTNNEIRTRSKTEEKREQGRIIDNLTKIIDEVAVNYSANHENDGEPPVKKKIVAVNSVSASDNCEIFVKSFAKIAPDSTENNNKITFPTPPLKHRARKSFPQPNYSKNTIKVTPKLVKEPPKVPPAPVVVQSKPNADTPKSVSKTTTAICVPLTTTVTTAAPQPTSKLSVPSLSQIEGVRPTNGYLILQQPQQDNLLFIPPNSSLNYTSTLGNQMVSMTPCLVSAPTSTALRQFTQPPTIWTPNAAAVQLKPSLNLNSSQNYIPQGERNNNNNNSNNNDNPPLPNLAIPVTTANTTTNMSLPIICSTLIENPNNNASLSKNPTNSSNTETTREAVTNETERAVTAEPEVISHTNPPDEFAVLNSLGAENISKAVSEIIKKPPPKLKPRPPGALSQQFSEGLPSSAGPVTSRINSVAHKLSDYFRGMLIETLEDLGKTSNPEATIANLKLEIETLRHRHAIELSEIEKNMCLILKDVQRSIVEDRDRLIEQTRAVCETEAIKRIEEAKSKQWCANCSKEAQFYCCWNTSYCDYPCQQKHWPTHMNKCTQNINQPQSTPTTMLRPNTQQLILRPANPPPKGGNLGRVITKPLQKVYVNRNMANSKGMRVQTTAGNVLTMMETTPGNYQLMSNSLLRPSNSNSNLKTGNVISLVPSATSSTNSNLPKKNAAPPKQPVKILNQSVAVATISEEDSD